MVSRSDRYGLGKALNAYEDVYTGLSKQYLKKFNSLEAQRDLADVCQGRWSRKSAEWNAKTTFGEGERQSLCREIQGNIDKMEQATKKTGRLLEDFTKGANFLDVRPIPVFRMQPDVQRLDLWRDDLQGKLRTISILFADIKERSRLAKLEGERLYQLVEPTKSSMFSSVWYALGRSSNVLESKIAQNSESDASVSDGSYSSDEGVEKHEHHVPPSSLRSGQILSDYRGGPDSDDVSFTNSEVDESKMDLMGRPMSSRRETNEQVVDSAHEGDQLKKSPSSNSGDLFSKSVALENARNFRESPLQFDEVGGDAEDERVGTLEERSADNSALVFEKRTPNSRRRSADGELLRKNSIEGDSKKDLEEVLRESLPSDGSLVGRRTPHSARRSIDEILEECSVSDGEEEIGGESNSVSALERTVSNAIPIPIGLSKNAKRKLRKKAKEARQVEN